MTTDELMCLSNIGNSVKSVQVIGNYHKWIYTDLEVKEFITIVRDVGAMTVFITELGKAVLEIEKL